MSPLVFLAALLVAGNGRCVLAAGEPGQPHEVKNAQPLTTLAVRLRKMLGIQVAIRDGTKELQQVIERIPGKKPRPEHERTALMLAAWEKVIVGEATRAIDLLKGEEAGTAFAEVFREVRKDMERLRQRLGRADVGADTQALEQNLIDSLEEMITALKSR